MLISNLRRICDALAAEKNIEQATQLIAINSCYSGNCSRIYIGRFFENFDLTTFASFGFKSQPGLISSYEKKLLPHLVRSVIQSNSIYFGEHDDRYQELFFSATGEKDESMWKTTVVIPLLPDFFATLSLTIEIKENVEAREYFEALRSVINLYLTFFSKFAKGSRESSKIRNSSLNSQDLTERQELILELMQEGKTNGAIATRMGYSESLIRQETIVIYRKLGIAGRKDLTSKSAAEQSDSADESEAQ